MEEKKNLVANVLICLNCGNGAPPEVAEKIRKVYEFKLRNNARDDFGCGNIKTVFTINISLHEGKFDVLFVQETIEGGQGVGYGTLKDWSRDYPNVRVFLLLDKKKKGQMKLYNLWSKGYYQAIYFQEIAECEDAFFDTIVNGRTKEEAFSYYGIEEIHKKMQESALVENEASEDAESVISEERSDAVENKVPAEEVVERNEKQLIPEEEKEVEEEKKTDSENESTGMEERTEDIPKLKPEEEFLTQEQQEEYEYQYPQTYLDLESMEVKAEVHFYLDGVINYIINDNDIIIRCPKGGLLRNAEALRNAKIQLTWKEPYQGRGILKKLQGKRVCQIACHYQKGRGESLFLSAFQEQEI